jgi:hypothetical protein
MQRSRLHPLCGCCTPPIRREEFPRGAPSPVVVACLVHKCRAGMSSLALSTPRARAYKAEICDCYGTCLALVYDKQINQSSTRVSCHAHTEAERAGADVPKGLRCRLSMLRLALPCATNSLCDGLKGAPPMCCAALLQFVQPASGPRCEYLCNPR